MLKTKYFPDLSGDDPLINIIRYRLLLQVAQIPSDTQEEFVELLNDHAVTDNFDGAQLFGLFG